MEYELLTKEQQVDVLEQMVVQRERDYLANAMTSIAHRANGEEALAQESDGHCVTLEQQRDALLQQLDGLRGPAGAVEAEPLPPEPAVAVRASSGA